MNKHIPIAFLVHGFHCLMLASSFFHEEGKMNSQYLSTCSMQVMSHRPGIVSAVMAQRSWNIRIQSWYVALNLSIETVDFRSITLIFGMDFIYLHFLSGKGGNLFSCFRVCQKKYTQAVLERKNGSEWRDIWRKGYYKVLKCDTETHLPKSGT